MWNVRPRRRAQSWRGGALRAATFIALVAGSSASPAGQANASAPARAGAAQSTSHDPCRFSTAEAMGKAFGRPMKSSKLANVCEYRGTGTDVVVVKVEAGPEGTILRHVKGASAQGHKGAEKVATVIGEAYFDSTLPVFIGRVGNHDVQIETTIQPVPRDAMIAVGTRIMETFALK
jgi:hypothetical protein